MMPAMQMPMPNMTNMNMPAMSPMMNMGMPLMMATMSCELQEVHAVHSDARGRYGDVHVFSLW